MKRTIKPKCIQMANCGHDLIYKCGNCGYGFNMAHEGYDYCPHCGNKIDWGVVYTVNEEWKSKYFNSSFDERRKMCEDIDKINQSITDGKKRELPKTQATKDAILFSNIDYYLGNGWSEKELINEGFFTKEEFERYKLRENK